jgi:hypothetical protein
MCFCLESRVLLAEDEKSQRKMSTTGRVAHTCNPSYSEGRDQEDRGTRSAGKKFMRPHLNKQTRLGGSFL